MADGYFYNGYLFNLLINRLQMAQDKLLEASNSLEQLLVDIQADESWINMTKTEITAFLGLINIVNKDLFGQNEVGSESAVQDMLKVLRDQRDTMYNFYKTSPAFATIKEDTIVNPARACEIDYVTWPGRRFSIYNVPENWLQISELNDLINEANDYLKENDDMISALDYDYADMTQKINDAQEEQGTHLNYVDSVCQEFYDVDEKFAQEVSKGPLERIDGIDISEYSVDAVMITNNDRTATYKVENFVAIDQLDTIQRLDALDKTTKVDDALVAKEQEEKIKWHTEALLKFGYSQDEIDILIRKGVILNKEDMDVLQLSQSTKKAYITTNKQGMIYSGKVYYINVPPGPMEGPTIGPIWDVVETKKETEKDFDLAAGILGISLEEIPKEEITTKGNYYHELSKKNVSSQDANASSAAVLHTMMGVGSILKSSLNHWEVTIVFEEAGPCRRVTIGVGDFQTRLKMQNINYNIDFNTYQNQTEQISKNRASEEAKQIYMRTTGHVVPETKLSYTLTGTLDSRHAETSISGYLSYSEYGELIYTPLIFSGDKAYVATCGFWGDVKEIQCEFTHLLQTPISADENTKKIFEKALEVE